MTRLLAEHGYAATGDEGLLDTAAALAIPVRNRLSLGNSRVMTADRAA
jgi:hypothetical protein